jgi:hypothetical protein
LEAAVALASSLDALQLANYQPTSFEPDPKVIQFEHNAKEELVCEGVRLQISKDVSSAAPLASFKRNSLSTMGGLLKRKRTLSKSSFVDSPFLESSNQSNVSITDPNFIRYHQMASQRRHSYAPLSSYQEQQFAWMNQQHSLSDPMSTAISNPSYPTFQVQHLTDIVNPSNIDMMMMQQQRLNFDRFTPAVRSKLSDIGEISKSASENQGLMYQSSPFQDNQMTMAVQGDLMQEANPQLFSEQYPNQNTNFIDTSQSHSFLDQSSWQWDQQQ